MEQGFDLASFSLGYIGLRFLAQWPIVFCSKKWRLNGLREVLILAGLGIAVSPLPDMQKFVVERQTGIVSSNQTWQSMANALNALSPDAIDHFKRNSLELARTLNAEVEMQKLMQIYEKLLSD